MIKSRWNHLLFIILMRSPLSVSFFIFPLTNRIPRDMMYYVRRGIMDIQMKRGLLDVCVLAAIKNEESYGYKIIKDLKA